jgi:hypothetical protein
VLAKTFIVASMRGGVQIQAMLEGAMQAEGKEGSWDEDEEGSVFRAIVRWGCEKKRWGGIEGNKLSWIIGQVIERIFVEE